VSSWRSRRSLPTAWWGPRGDASVTTLLDQPAGVDGSPQVLLGRAAVGSPLRRAQPGCG
jgi:hypothetical protein